MVSSSSSSISVFVPSRFEKLHRVITEAVHHSDRLARSNDWYVAVDKNRAELVDLARVKPSNDTERKEIESGNITIDGIVQSINADFAQLTLLLSRELSVSEHFAASLLQEGIAGRARWGQGATEVACILYHRERLAMLACLKDLIRNALTLPFEDDSEAKRLGAKMEQLVESLVLFEIPAVVQRKVTLAERILTEIDAAKQSIASVHNSLRSAQPAQQQSFGLLGIGGSNTATQTGHHIRLSDEIQLERLSWLQQERRELGHILYLLSISSLLSTSNITAIIRRLAAVKPQETDEITIYILTALLGAIDTNADARSVMAQRATRTSSRKTVDNLMDDEAFITSTHTEITKTNWAIGELNSVVSLQWSVFLVEAFSRNPSFRVHLSLSDEHIQDLVMRSITGSSASNQPAATTAASPGPKGDAFVYLILRILAFRQKALDALDGAEEEAGDTDVAHDTLDQSLAQEEIDFEFREYVIQQVQNLILSTTSIMLPILRKIQRLEEDAAFAISRGMASRSASAAPPERRYDIEALFDLVALLCRGRPESGLPFWIGSDKRITRFISWAIDVREPGHQRALLNMLAAMSSGTQSASQAYALLDQESGGGGSDARLISWARLFEWLKYYVETFRQAEQSSGNGTAAAVNGVGMPPDEAILLQGFIRLLRNVVYYSSAARDSLHQNASYAPLEHLFSLYTRPIPIDLKATILDALAAFAHNSVGSGSKYSSIATDLWNRLEASKVIQTADAASQPTHALNASVFGTSVARSPQAGGVVYELEQVEVPNRRFPGTISFINFLKALIRLPPQPRDVPSLLSAQPMTSTTNPFSSIVGLPGTQTSFTFEAQQQQQQRGRSVEPYVNFVIDHILLQARSKEYVSPTEQWRIISSCLDFIQRSLCSYDVSALLKIDEATGADAVSNPILLNRLASHPGFFIMKRLLTGTKLVAEILQVLIPGAGVAGFEAVNQNKAKTLFYSSSVKHALRIVQRVLRIQNVFTQVLVPTLIEAPTVGLGLPFDVAARVGSPGAYSSLDTHLLHAHESVVQIALFVNCIRDDIALLSIRLLSLIAKSAAFSAVDRFGEMGYRRKMNRLVGLLEMSDEAERVRAGYVARLEAEPSLEADPRELSVQRLLTLAGEDDEAEGQFSSQVDGLMAPALDAVEAIRIAILNLLLTNTATDQSSPNLAHLLLGFDLRAVRPEEQVIPDPQSQTSSPSALHAILSLLKSQDKGGQASSSNYLSLAERSPGLAEKCYALVLRLCTHPFTSSATLRYLRTKEDFVVQQLKALPLLPAERKVASSGSESLGLVQFPDGRDMSTSVDCLVASLRLRAQVLDLAALELHTLLNVGMHSRAARILAVLFGVGATAVGTVGLGEDEQETDEGFLCQPDFGYGPQGQTFGGVRFLEILQSLDFIWNDERDAVGQNITMIRPEQLDRAKRPDADIGPRVYDLKAVFAILLREKAMLQQQGTLRDAGQGDPFLQQAAYVLHWASAQNAKRAIAYSRRRSLQAWRHTLDMVLARATGLLRIDTRSTLMFECLSELLPRISSPTQDADSDPAVADIVAGAVLSLLTSLRQHRIEINVGALEFESADLLPADRLISTLRALVDSIVRLGTSTLGRGNLYSALINFLQLLQATPKDAATDGFNDAMSVAATDMDDTVSLGGLSSFGTVTGGKSQASALEARTKVLLLGNAERLVDVIARDALDAADVWKTVAFTLLDKLCALEVSAGSGLSRRGGSKCLDLLVRRGFLTSFVTALRDSDVTLQDTLRPDPDSLNALYVYEARLAFFNRTAQSREGAERLLDAKIFDALAQADFITARPEQDQDFVDLDSFLPAATERYNSLLTPVLQLSTSILAVTNVAVGGTLSSSSSMVSFKSIAPTSSHAAPRQAVSLLTAHRETFLAVLKTPTLEFCSISQLEQAYLLVSMFVFVLPMLDDDALLAPNPLAPFHSAILALASQYLYSASWKPRIVPFNDAEREEARIPANAGSAMRWAGEGAGEETVFEARIDAVISRMQIALLGYLEAASDSRGNAQARTRSVLIPSLVAHRDRSRTPFGESVTLSRDDELASSMLRTHRAASGAAVPSLGTLIASLEEYATKVTKELQALENTVNVLENADGVRMDEWDEIARDALKTTEIPADLGPSQRRSIALRELKSRKVHLVASSTVKLDAIELILVLLIRHLDLFLRLPTTNSGGNGPILSESVLQSGDYLRASSLRPQLESSLNHLGTANDKSHLLKELASLLIPILEEKLGYLSLPPSLVANARERQSLLQMAGRRLASFFSDE